jgi:glyoxylase-like metal-dependent hydrolase (beta-lactamase superfamily II)
VGSADYLRRHLPGLRIGAHQRTAAVARKPSAIETMNRLSLGEMGLLQEDATVEDVRLHPFEIDILLKHGDEFDLGGLTCRVYETPGHTRDSLAYFFPEIKALFPGDACGVLLRMPEGKIQVEFVASYDAYVDSLKLMTALEPEILCLAHNWVLTHQEAADFLQRSLAETYRYRELIEGHLRAADGDIQEAIEGIVRADYGLETAGREPPAAYLTNVAAQVKHIAQHTGWSDG